MLAQARKHVSPGVELNAVTAPFGSPHIASRATYAVAAHAAIEAYSQYDGARPDIVVLCCFGDPGLEALRELAPQPIIGLAEASIRAAQTRGGLFAIVTIGKGWVSMLEERVTILKAGAHCVGIYAVDASPSDLAADPSRAIVLLEETVGKAMRAGAESVVLGGGALAGLSDHLNARVRCIDCIQAAMAEAMSYTSRSR